MPVMILVGQDKKLGCVWFEDKGGWDMAIHGFRDMDIHVVCLVGWMGRAIFLFGWMDEIAWDENT